MQIKENLAFTLIELVITITLFFIISAVMFVPYNHYITKEKVRITKKDISQSLYEARNLAINGSSSGSNISVGLYFEKDKNKISFFSYPYTYSGSQIGIIVDRNIKLLKEYTLQPKVEITSVGGNYNGLFFFEAVTGSGSYYYFNPNQNEISDTKIKINFSYNKADPTSLFAGEVTYYTETNIVDY